MGKMELSSVSSHASDGNIVPIIARIGTKTYQDSVGWCFYNPDPWLCDSRLTYPVFNDQSEAPICFFLFLRCSTKSRWGKEESYLASKFPRVIQKLPTSIFFRSLSQPPALFLWLCDATFRLTTNGQVTIGRGLRKLKSVIQQAVVVVQWSASSPSTPTI